MSLLDSASYTKIFQWPNPLVFLSEEMSGTHSQAGGESFIPDLVSIEIDVAQEQRGNTLPCLKMLNADLCSYFFPHAAMVILKINFQVPDQFCSRVILLQCAAFLLHCEICAGILWNWVWSLWCIMFQKSPYQHNSSLSWAEEEICYPFHVWSYRDSGTFTKCWILKTICILL